MAHYLQAVSCILCKPRKAKDIVLEEAMARGINAAAALPGVSTRERALLHAQSTRLSPRRLPSSSSTTRRSSPSLSITRRKSSRSTPTTRQVPETVPQEQSASTSGLLNDNAMIVSLEDDDDDDEDMQPPPPLDSPLFLDQSGPQAALCPDQPVPKDDDNDNDGTTTPLTFYEYMQRAAASSSTTHRRRSKRFTNIHPAHEKIKAKLDIFEGRKQQQSLEPDELTESETMDSSDHDTDASRPMIVVVPPGQCYQRRRSSLLAPGQARQVKDCENDPYAAAYKVWYNKGLLYFRPKGLPERLPVE